MLQKALVKHLVSLEIAAIIADRSFPLSYLTTDEGLTYSSAIAPMICASQSQENAQFADQLAILLQSSLRDNTKPPQRGCRTIADHLRVEATPHGWLKLTLSESGIAGWLDFLQSIDTSDFRDLTKQQQPLPTFVGHSFPLCDRLQLSLPMLLKWAYIRCSTLIEAAQSLTAKSFQPTASTSLVPKTLPSWTNDSPPLCHELLKAVIQVIDYLAAQLADDKTFLRQGYALASAIYTFDAALPTVTISQHSPAIQVAIGSILRAARKILALIFVGLFGEDLP